MPILDAKRFHRRLERLLEGLEGGPATPRYASEVVPLLLRELGADLGVAGAHVYQRDADRARLLESWGESATDLAAELPRRLSASDDSAIADLPWVGETGAGMAVYFACHWASCVSKTDESSSCVSGAVGQEATIGWRAISNPSAR